jgi:hypothetical protein
MTWDIVVYDKFSWGTHSLGLMTQCLVQALTKIGFPYTLVLRLGNKVEVSESEVSGLVCLDFVH